MENKITITFPAEAANKLADFQSTLGEKAWNNILREFDSFLGVLPSGVTLYTNGKTINLPVKVHAGAGR